MKSPFHEITVRCDPERRPFKTRYELTSEERLDIIQTIGDSACLLMAYYFRMATIKDKYPSDQDAADYFGWKEHKVRRYRLALTKAGYYRTLRFTMANGRKGISIYLGRDAVQESYKGETQK